MNGCPRCGAVDAEIYTRCMTSSLVHNLLDNNLPIDNYAHIYPHGLRLVTFSKAWTTWMKISLKRALHCSAWRRSELRCRTTLRSTRYSYPLYIGFPTKILSYKFTRILAMFFFRAVSAIRAASLANRVLEMDLVALSTPALWSRIAFNLNHRQS